VPLDSYGVLAGTLHRSFRDRPDDQGRWFHVNLEVDAPAGRYRCAVDVDSKASAVGVQWKVLTVASPQLVPMPDLAPGVHALAPEPGTAALDHQRHPRSRAPRADLRRAVRGGAGDAQHPPEPGRPGGSQWWDENAIWQDGGTVTEPPDGRFDVFLSTFSSQAFRTDDDGHPVA
jgi:hypothetical protein